MCFVDQRFHRQFERRIKNDMKGDSQLLVDRLELVIHGNVRAALERLRIDKA